MKTGAVVRLRSGGPLMTLKGIDPSRFGQWEACWFERDGESWRLRTMSAEANAFVEVEGEPPREWREGEEPF